jgi:hypothetical protein
VERGQDRDWNFYTYFQFSEHHRFLANVSEFSSLAPKALSGSRFGQKRAAEFVEMSNFVAVKEKRSSTETADGIYCILFF